MQICRVCSRFVRVRRDIQNCRHLKGLPRRSMLRRPAGRRCPGRKLPLFRVVSFQKKRTLRGSLLVDSALVLAAAAMMVLAR